MMRIVRAILFRFRALFDRCALDAELERELDDHIAREARANVARGMSPAEARQAALAAFGGVQHVKEDTREAHGMHLLDAVMQDTRHAIRSLLRSPAFTATVVVTLALGVGANAAVYSLLERIYLREPAGVPNPSELRRLYELLPAHAPMNGGKTDVVATNFDYATYSEFRDALNGRASVALYAASDSVGIGEGDAPIPARRSYVSDTYFSTLGVRAARGRFFTASETVPGSSAGVAVITDALWQGAFDRDPGVIGRTIIVDRKPFVVIGVSGDEFTGVDLNKADLFLPLGAFEGEGMRNQPWYVARMSTYFKVVVRVPHGDDRFVRAVATTINRRANSAMRGQTPSGTNPDTLSSIVTGPIIAALGPADNPKEYAIGMRVAGVCLLVLMIACANITNLLLVRALRRRHEVAVRLALGVSRRRLAAQFLTEGIVLAVAGGTAGVLVAAWGGTMLRALILPRTHWAAPALDLSVLAYALGAALLTGIIASILPTLQGARVEIISALKPGERSGARTQSRVRASLLAAQTALSLVLLAGAGLFVRSLQRIQSIPLGYASDQLSFASVRFDGPSTPWKHQAERRASFPLAAERLRNVPGVIGVALAQNAPMQSGSATRFWTPGNDSIRGSYFNAVSPEFFEVAGIRLLRGRVFGADDRRDAGGPVIVNSTMAKEVWPNASALGQCLRINDVGAPCSTVVGVVEDEHVMSVLEEKPSAQFFTPMRAAVDSESASASAILVRTRAGDWHAADQVAKAELKRDVPTAIAVTFTPMSRLLEPQFRSYRLGATLFTAFGILALIVAAVGIYGIIAYSFSQRTLELGVRAALGASAGDTYRLVLGDAMKLTAIGIVAGVAIALASGKLVSSLLYATSPRDPVVLVGAASGLVLAALAASIVPALRASRADPMEALRAE